MSGVIRVTGAGVIAACWLVAVVQADVLVLRDGTRVEGRLVAVRDASIEFQERSGWAGGRVRTFDRADVRSIQFDERIDSDSSRGDPYDGDGRGGARPGMRERTVAVQAREQWTNTGITVRAGQPIVVGATGTVRWGPGRKDGPAGERNSPRNEGRPMPNRSAGALIGRIGPDGAPFFIGDDPGQIRMRDSGPLYLGINDDYVNDNSGSFRVTVSF
jgi:PA-IL-like protein